MRSFGGGVRTDGRTYIIFSPCVLQDIGPLGPLPKKKKKKRKKKMLNSCLTRLIAGLEEMI